MRHTRVFPFAFVSGLILLTVLATPVARAGDDWPPISPEERAMKDNPASPGAHAMLLYREEHTDDVESFDRRYYRIKIFTEEGKKYANVEIPYFKDMFSIADLKARTIRPDGTVVNFDGKVFEKTVAKARGVKFLAKTFTLPDVQVGSIIEFKYKVRWDVLRVFATHWVIQHSLFTRRALFSLRPYRFLGLRWINVRIPGNKMAQEGKDGIIRLELENVPAFQEEEYMPPEDELKSRVDFFYTRNTSETPDQFWKREGKEWYEFVQDFIGTRRGIAQAAAALVAPTDPPETKLRKLYARVQQIRNLSYERFKTAAEERREKLKDNAHVEDVLKHGYGYRNEINRLFVALARAAGFDASVVRVSQRDDYFFAPMLLEARQLNGEVALVRFDSKELYLDPGTLYCPFRLLSWENTGVKGIRLDKDGGTFVTTPNPVSTDAVTERRATLQLGDDGILQGKVTVTFTGQEALRRRREGFRTDDSGRRKSLEEEVKEWLPTGATVELLQATGWQGSEEPLRAELTVSVPNWGSATGRRLLLPVTVFQTSKTHQMESTQRVHPVYFDYPYQNADEITLQLPANYQVGGVPAPQKRATPFGKYDLSCEAQGNTLRLQRRMALEGILIPAQYYRGLRGFLDSVRTGDEEQMVLQSKETAQHD